MYNVRKVQEDLIWVGASDHRLNLFENIHPIPRGVSYNSYVLLDEKNVLFDTVDWSVCGQFLENLKHVLDGKKTGCDPHPPCRARSFGKSGRGHASLSGS
ncbi:H(2)O-forming NADH oxidase [Faecalicoccus pleomorphus]|uniref:H(2)O-forming NADH oxidase n=1 Tax=Faecalicoccus pleomorphus TaxID=1323 RepID=A0A380LQA5_9FIRM|nr:hypothetical protein [Faecalicoccus pleomorphus]SUO05012.1 H(2)O-forming NADH oxidase [Faecalicoccus pleomorphus]